ncbi:unnamed protein product [Vitrella brassicaformis CCMP3155]|uniref:Uncharacterized protein n=2 Tax=Vitrella brassicaformis TaxID=1169539 RepID=A0A0G4GYX6_VITBC|nr:unnamed protein product [Vitrella brassicaformis CCMP3155]|mmetsp:Transcript_21172/g.51686  ORF Transcript_21172/g.51686 Transcript_21172/m.51686 type:complete len:293 (+) Transcript_21172:141-1019(+)|eukprot:CEM36368.1 unnamed protein product [Vitrella brassicaformis CCMP3155]
MGCGGSKVPKLANYKEVVACLCDRRAEDADGKVDKDKAAKEVDELTGKYKAKDDDADWTMKRERMELRKWALKVVRREGWGEDGVKLVDKVLPDDVAELDMKVTKIPEFDELFGKASDPMNTCISLRSNLDEGSEALKEACEFGGKECKTIKDAIKNLKEEAKNVKFNVKANPDMTLDIDAPEADGPIANAIEAIKTFANCCANVIKECPALVTQVQELAEAAKEFPSKVIDAAKNAGLAPGDMMAAAKHTGTNSKSLTKLPEVIKQTAEQAKKSAEELKEAAMALGESPAE